MYAPLDQSSRRLPYWFQTTWGEWAVAVNEHGSAKIIARFSEQEYFKLKLANKTEDALKKAWEEWRKKYRPEILHR